MEIAEFIELKRSRWVDLEKLLDKAEARGLKGLNLEDAKALSRLYRGSSSDLLWMRAHGGSSDVSEYLNDLVGRAYALTYPGKRARWSDVKRFLLIGFPDLMRQEWRVYLAAAVLTLSGVAFGYVGMVIDPEAGHYLVPEEHMRLDPVKRAAEEAKEAPTSTDSQAAFASFLFTHNIQVAFLAFAAGITAGVGTAILLFFNGVLLGSLAWVYASKGLAGWFWAWILPHGIPELTAIAIAGAAGFVIARGMVAPKGLARREAVRLEAVTAVKLLLGTLALFVLAGLIEGSISQIHPPRLSVTFKISFALALGSAVYAYLGSAWLRGATEARALKGLAK
ncbi:MAG: stage II sporulation protein M [Myxococcaceae bacterium]|nr:stage II sporulation protein M [Myxococcaceae bacterium]